MKNIDFQRNLEVTGEYDVLVCGGGLSGVVAALAAAREPPRRLWAAPPESGLWRF